MDLIRALGIRGMFGEPWKLLARLVSYVTAPMIEGGIREKLLEMRAARRIELAGRLEAIAADLHAGRVADASAKVAALVGEIRL